MAIVLPFVYTKDNMKKKKTDISSNSHKNLLGIHYNIG